MRNLRLFAAATLTLAFASQVGAQTSKPTPEVVVAPFLVESDSGDALRAVSASCSKLFAETLENMGAVLARLSKEEGQYRLELQLLDVKSGDELRSYFNADKDPQVA